MSFNYSDIEDILKANDFSRLKSQAENIYFDVKEYPYQLDLEKVKRELCKDVTAFANTDGGFIIIGISEKSLENSPYKVVDEVKGVDKTKLIKQTYIQCLENMVYPKIDFLEFEFIKLNGKDIFYIKISSDLKNKPYLVKGNNDFFAYYKRTDENALTTDVKEIHEFLLKGLDYQNTLNLMDRKLDLLVERTAPEDEIRIHQLNDIRINKKYLYE